MDVELDEHVPRVGQGRVTASGALVVIGGEACANVIGVPRRVLIHLVVVDDTLEHTLDVSRVFVEGVDVRLCRRLLRGRQRTDRLLLRNDQPLCAEQPPPDARNGQKPMIVTTPLWNGPQAARQFLGLSGPWLFPCVDRSANRQWQMVGLLTF